jgi:[ribosomal protein S5]-alanine N-acetyltransferase
MKKNEARVILETERLFLRPWKESDAKSLYKYAKDPRVGPVAGWPPHKDEKESLDVIKNILIGPECYAICLKTDNVAIGCIELKLNGRTDMTDKDDECELGYWIGVPFWGKGYMSEAVREIVRHGFQDLGMNTIWCGYYDGNEKSKRVQEKCGFVYHHTCNEVPVPLMGETRIGHTNVLTKEQWQSRRFTPMKYRSETF